MGTRPGAPDPPELVAIGADEEEALPNGGALSWLLQTPRQRRLVVAVLVLVVGAAVAGMLTSHRPRNHSAPTVAPSSVAVIPLVAELNPNLPAECAHEISCVSAEAVPRGTSAAISASLTGADERLTFTVTQRDTDRLVYRVVNATSRDVELLVIIRLRRLAQSAVTETIDPSPGAAIRYVRRQVGQYEVQVQYTGPPGRTPAVELAVRLSQDPRLLEVD
jgi:hypothetical protein